jgi:hypothetical protein
LCVKWITLRQRTISGLFGRPPRLRRVKVRLGGRFGRSPVFPEFPTCCRAATTDEKCQKLSSLRLSKFDDAEGRLVGPNKKSREKALGGAQSFSLGRKAQSLRDHREAIIQADQEYANILLY